LYKIGIFTIQQSASAWLGREGREELFRQSESCVYNERQTRQRGFLSLLSAWVIPTKTIVQSTKRSVIFTEY